MNYIFDVDGTLTPSRGIMNDEFRSFFLEFAKNNDCYLVTGGDRNATIRQVGPEIYNACKLVFNCCGNDVYEQDNQIYKNIWQLSFEAMVYLKGILRTSEYPTRTGWHFDHRIGMCNFSVVGRNADRQQRTDYFEWDKESDERGRICSELNSLYPYLEARVGGETGVDIFERGKHKGQILDYFDDGSDIMFFGDRTDEQGNDYPIASRLSKDQSFQVRDDLHTMELLKFQENNNDRVFR